MIDTPRISASSYSNTAPLIWSFLYGRNHGRAEVILDNAPARSAELLAGGRVDAALVPVIAFQMLDGVRLVPGVCVAARERVKSVCLITKGADLADVKSVALDTSSQTSVALTKIIFREFLGFEPEWQAARPDVGEMLAAADAALLIGDPALELSLRGGPSLRTFDVVSIWREHTGLGFIFAMWMTPHDRLSIDLAAARDEGVGHIPAIAANYAPQLGLPEDAVEKYLSQNISYKPDAEMQDGMSLYFDLAGKHGLIPGVRPLTFTDDI
jgi:chorismate dehydratase